MIKMVGELIPGLTYRVHKEAKLELDRMRETDRLYHCPFSRGDCMEECIAYDEGGISRSKEGFFDIDPPRCLWLASVLTKQS